MGCGPSKAEQETKEEGKKEPTAAGSDAASPNDVKVKVPEEPAKNSAGRRVSKTVRRIAVRCKAK